MAMMWLDTEVVRQTEDTVESHRMHLLQRCDISQQLKYMVFLLFLEACLDMFHIDSVLN